MCGYRGGMLPGGPVLALDGEGEVRWEQPLDAATGNGPPEWRRRTAHRT
jgi:hypothetical protein